MYPNPSVIEKENEKKKKNTKSFQVKLKGHFSFLLLLESALV